MILNKKCAGQSGEEKRFVVVFSRPRVSVFKWECPIVQDGEHAMKPEKKKESASTTISRKAEKLGRDVLTGERIFSNDSYVKTNEGYCLRKNLSGI